MSDGAPRWGFRQVGGYGGVYWVNRHGQVYSKLSNRVLKPGRTSAGYLTVNLCGAGTHRSHYVHVLVAKSFIDNPLRKPTVNHRNGIRHQNTRTNLEWATYSENHLHAYRELNRDRLKGRKHGADNLKSTAVLQHLPHGVSLRFETLSAAAKAVGCTYGSITQAIARAGLCAGFRWSYAG